MILHEIRSKEGHTHTHRRQKTLMYFTYEVRLDPFRINKYELNSRDSLAFMHSLRNHTAPAKLSSCFVSTNVVRVSRALLPSLFIAQDLVHAMFVCSRWNEYFVVAIASPWWKSQSKLCRSERCGWNQLPITPHSDPHRGLSWWYNPNANHCVASRLTSRKNAWNINFNKLNHVEKFPRW